MSRQSDPSSWPRWTFLSNHGHVLLAVAQDRDVRIRDLADRVGITDRAVQLILNDLVEAGYLTRHRIGRRNAYELAPGRPFRHPLESGHSVDELVAVFSARGRPAGVGAGAPPAGTAP